MFNLVPSATLCSRVWGGRVLRLSWDTISKVMDRCSFLTRTSKCAPGFVAVFISFEIACTHRLSRWSLNRLRWKWIHSNLLSKLYLPVFHANDAVIWTFWTLLISTRPAARWDLDLFFTPAAPLHRLFQDNCTAALWKVPLWYTTAYAS